MPHFDEYGGDEWICQICGGIYNSRVVPQWNPYITGSVTASNVCPRCMKAHDECHLVGDKLRKYVQEPISLREHCRRESGLDGAALDRYINRYYGHG